MFGLSFAEIAVVLVIAIVVFGPKKLPELIRIVAKGYRETKKFSNSIRDAIDFEDNQKKRIQENAHHFKVTQEKDEDLVRVKKDLVDPHRRVAISLKPASKVVGDSNQEVSLSAVDESTRRKEITLSEAAL